MSENASITSRRLSFKLFARFLRPGDLIHQRIAHSCRNITSAFSSARHDAWHTRLTDELLRLYYIYKAHRGSDDKIRMDLTLLHHLIQSNKGRRRVADGKDAACMVDYVRSRFGKDTKIVMIGCSMGAISVLNSQLHTELVDAIIEDSSPDHVIDVLPHFYSTLIKLPNPFLKPVIASVSRKVGYDIRKNNPVDAAAQIKCPVCVMHGEADRTVPVEMGHNIYKALKNPLRRIEAFPGRDHCYEIMDTERYTKIVNEFVEAALSK